MATIDAADKSRIRNAATALREAERPVRILRSIAWAPRVRETFIASGGESLPVVEYAPFDPGPTLRALDLARSHIAQSNPVDEFLQRQATAIESSARMLAAVGTKDFFECSRRLYGSPSEAPAGASVTPLELARSLEGSLGSLDVASLRTASPSRRSVDEVASSIERAVTEHFKDKAPEVVIVDDLSANAIAGPRRIQLRRDASFTDLDARQLIEHEAFIHVATSLNGREQRDIPILAASHAGTTRTQEGLAVFAEFISGAIDVDRMMRLAGRVRAIDMAVNGADFVEVYRFFRSRGAAQDQAFENTRRVFRGGVLSGGAPFTKDGVYLDGLLRIHDFLHAVISARRLDCLHLLFLGKLDIEDIPALAQLTNAGLCAAPLFLPPWARDVRLLAAHLAYSQFLDGKHPAQIRDHYARVLRDTPTLDR